MFFCFHSGYSNRDICVAAALMYSFSTFALVQGFEFWTFLAPMISVPLVVAGIQAIVEKKIDVTCRLALIVGCFFQALNGFYFLFGIAIFGISFFIIYSWGQRGIQKWLKKGYEIFCFSLLGVCMAGAIFIPAVVGFLQSSRNGAQGDIDLFYNLGEYIVYLKNLFIPRAFEGGLGITIPFVLSFVLLWRCHNVAQRVKSLTIFWGICYITPLCGTIMNGFSYTTTRWQFVLYFIAALIFVEVWDKPRVEAKKSNWIFYIGLIGSSIYFHAIDLEEMNAAVIFRLSLYFLLAVLPVVFWRKRNAGNILLFCICAICLNICMIFGPVFLGGSGYRAGFLQYKELKEMEDNSIFHDIKKKEEIYRLDAWDFSLGASLIFDYYGTAEYFSIENKAVSDFYREFMLSPGMVSTWTFYGLDGRSVLEDLLSVQYYIENKQSDDGYRQEILKNEDVRPMGLFFDSYLPESDFAVLDPINKMDIVSEYVVLDEVPEGIKVKRGEIECKDYSIPYKIEYQNIKQEDGFLYVNEKSRIYIYPNIEKGAEGELYVSFRNLKRYSLPGKKLNLSKIQVGNRQIQVLDAAYSAEAGINIWDYMTHANYGVNVPDVIEISFSEKDKLEIGSIDVYLYPSVSLSSSEASVDLQEKYGDIYGKIVTNSDGILFISIPYSSGWSAEVDGEKKEVLRANIGFLAIPLKEGVHTFSMKYTTPGLKLGIFASVFGLCGCICYYLLVKRKNKLC